LVEVYDHHDPTTRTDALAVVARAVWNGIRSAVRGALNGLHDGRLMPGHFGMLRHDMLPSLQIEDDRMAVRIDERGEDWGGRHGGRW
jgi:hypothetical protein